LSTPTSSLGRTSCICDETLRPVPSVLQSVIAEAPRHAGCPNSAEMLHVGRFSSSRNPDPDPNHPNEMCFIRLKLD
jgi:hypothetical protein